MQQVYEHSLRLLSREDCGPFFLVGASMGGMIVARAAALLPQQTAGCVFVCSTLPAPWCPPTDKMHPAIVRWAGGDVEETRLAIPDASLDTCQWCAGKWRDESGNVLNDLGAGIEWPVDRETNMRFCVVVPLGDDSITPDAQLAFGAGIGACTLSYPGMSHCGPLLADQGPHKHARDVAVDVSDWIEGLTTF